LLEHKPAVFDHLVARWRELFNVSFDVPLYDLTSNYFFRRIVRATSAALDTPVALRSQSSLSTTRVRIPSTT
jgi:hypothetical protein